MGRAGFQGAMLAVAISIPVLARCALTIGIPVPMAGWMRGPEWAWRCQAIEWGSTAKSLRSGETLSSPWLTVTEAADRARGGPKLIYREVRARRLRAAHVGERRELRLRAERIDTGTSKWADSTPPESAPLQSAVDTGGGFS